MEIPDETLVARYQQKRCAESLDCLLDRYSNYLPKLLLQMGVSEAACGDVTQDVLIKAFRALDQFAGKSSFRTWITRIVINQAKDHFRRTRREQERGGSILEEVVDPLHGSPRQDPHVSLEFDEQMEKLENAIQTLSHPLRMALVLTAVQGMSPADAATALGCSRNTLYFRIHKAKKLLRRQLVR
ncbi:MAG: RNA polymerase sigma factor [Planctomycetota bacterium]